MTDKLVPRLQPVEKAQATIPRLLEIALKISPFCTSLNPSTSALEIAERFFVMGFRGASSFNRLDEVIKLNSEGLTDLTSLAAIARMIMETYEAFYVTCVDRCDMAEREVRSLASRLHWDHERRRISALFDLEEGFFGEGLWEVMRLHSISELRRNEYFRRLPREEREGIEYGRRPYRSLARAHRLRGDRHALYALLSNCVHSTHLALAFHGRVQVKGTLGERATLEVCRGVVWQYFGRTTREYLKLRPRLNGRLNHDEKQYLRELPWALIKPTG